MPLPPSASPSRCSRWSLPSALASHCRRRPWSPAASARKILKTQPSPPCRRLCLGSLISAALGIPAGIEAPHLLRLMGASPAIVATGSGYARIALGGCGAIIMLFLNNAIFRGAGDAAIAMRLLWVSNIINLILDPCLIFGLGPPSPTLASPAQLWPRSTGRSIGVLYQFYRLMRGTERIQHPGPPHLHQRRRYCSACCAFPLRHPPVRHRQRQLDRPRPHHLPLRRRSRRRLHRCHSHRGVLHPARMGAQQRRRHPGRPEPGRRPSRARRAGRLAHRPLQHAFPGHPRRLLHRLRHAHRCASSSMIPP